MEYNPFAKEIDINKLYKTKDFNEARTRLEFLEKTKGIGLFTGNPGCGKTYAIKNYLDNLNSSLYKIVYLHLTTVGVNDFYRSLCLGLGLETFYSKTKMFVQIQEHIRKLVIEQKKHLFIAIDECQLLKPEILTDLKILFNFEMDSKNLATVLLIGLPVINYTLSKTVFEDLNQRILMKYDFKGIGESEIREYISDRLRLVKASEDIFTEDAIKSMANIVNGSIRRLNLIIERALIIGALDKVARSKF